MAEYCPTCGSTVGHAMWCHHSRSPLPFSPEQGSPGLVERLEARAAILRQILNEQCQHDAKLLDEAALALRAAREREEEQYQKLIRLDHEKADYASAYINANKAADQAEERCRELERAACCPDEQACKHLARIAALEQVAEEALDGYEMANMHLDLNGSQGKFRKENKQHIAALRAKVKS